MDKDPPLRKELWEWFALIQNFRLSKESRQKSLNAWQLTEDALLEHILKILKNDKDEVLKINLLIFLQENVNFFLEDAKVYVPIEL
jgi:hypothetical protein